MMVRGKQNWCEKAGCEEVERAVREGVENSASSTIQIRIQNATDVIA